MMRNMSIMQLLYAISVVVDKHPFRAGLKIQKQPLIWVKVFKNGPSKISGRQPLKNLK